MKTKSCSRTARILIRNVILLTLLALALCEAPTIAVAADCVPVTNWTYPGADSWFVSRDWDSGEPDLSTAAQVNGYSKDKSDTESSTYTRTAPVEVSTLRFAERSGYRNSDSY